jgi:hypothetical protein
MMRCPSLRRPPTVGGPDYTIWVSIHFWTPEAAQPHSAPGVSIFGHPLAQEDPPPELQLVALFFVGRPADVCDSLILKVQAVRLGGEPAENYPRNVCCMHDSWLMSSHLGTAN